MRAYKIELPNNAYTLHTVAFAGSKVGAGGARSVMMDAHGVARSAITIVEIDIPTGKDGLLAFLNNLVK